MDDLSGLDWSSSSADNANQKPPPMSQGFYYPTLNPTPPVSGRTTPLVSQTRPAVNGSLRSNASTPNNDSFANLVSFKSANPNKNLSLQEQEKALQEQRLRKQKEQEKHNNFHQDKQDAIFWEKLGSGTTTPNHITSPPAYAATEEYGGHRVSKAVNKPFAHIDTSQRRPMKSLSSEDNDLLSGFEVSHNDPATGSATSKWTSEGHDIISGIQSAGDTTISGMSRPLAEDDDDPFGLGAMSGPKSTAIPTKESTPDGDEDILGLLGRPVSEFPKPEERTSVSEMEEPSHDSPLADRALAELVDMGFDMDKSREALHTTESGTDVHAAIGWLLSQAHQDSRNEHKHAGLQEKVTQRRFTPSSRSRMSPPRRSSGDADEAKPAWMQDRTGSCAGQQRQDSKSPVNGEKDPSKMAAELGNNLFKTANSLWKTGTKKLNKAVAELNSDSDSSQPRWMRDSRPETETRSQRQQLHATHRTRQGAPPAADSEVTDEALMLESGDARPPPRKSARSKPTESSDLPRPESPVPSSPQTRKPQPRFMQQQAARPPPGNQARSSRQVLEERSSEMYVSPARRRKAMPQPQPPAPVPTILLEDNENFKSSDLTNGSRPATKTPAPQSSAKASLPLRPQPPQRKIPQVSSSALQSSHSSRQAGTAAFKRGDYAEATTCYTSALAPIPPFHPLSIPLLTNRALSYLKTGDPKACIADSNLALELIGPARGVSETVDLGNEGSKDMHVYWGKAMTRQAEALEQLERWSDAGNAWKSCVEAGVGGATSISGRNRCEKAVKGPSITKTPLTARKPPPPKPKPKSSALDDLSGSLIAPTEDSGEAVTRLRAANLAAERLDDEKFALSDKVSDRVTRWRSGKEGNLRALLGSLDTVLWEGAGWKKVGMGELVLANRVKVVYMKGIGKVHPDKLPTTATTEQRMVSAAVFATLNEAWDGFKRENGL